MSKTEKSKGKEENVLAGKSKAGAKEQTVSVQPSIFDDPKDLFSLGNRKSRRGGDESQEDNEEEKRTQGGVPSSQLVMSAYIGGNAKVFEKLMALHVPTGARVADVTYGKGVFWQAVPSGRYEVHKSDMDENAAEKTGEPDVNGGIDCRDLPYEDESLGALVLDPPYMEGFFRGRGKEKAGTGTHDSFRGAYSGGTESRHESQRGASSKWYGAVIDLYLDAGREAFRVLSERGVFVVKCQDAVSANRQNLTHVTLTRAFEEMGFYAKDLFVVVRTGRPGASRIRKQVHARKRHSYFLVFVKPPEGTDPLSMRSSAPKRA